MFQTYKYLECYWFLFSLFLNLKGDRVMKKLLIFCILSILLLPLSCTQNKKPEISEELKKGLRADAIAFTQTLRSVLIKEIQTGGILKAVAVCSDTAQILTNKYGVEKGIFIKRVSFKNRNPNNFPDEFESRVLKMFEDLKSKNQLTPETEYAEVIDENGILKVRYLKPIIVQPECLNCHGPQEQISPSVMETINRIYPNDKAKNYQIDDLRGAVSIQKTL